MRRKILVSFYVVLLVAYAVPALSAVVSIFGPEEFVKAQGKPVTYTRTFRVAPGVSNCKLWVQNGIDGTQEVKNVTVTVNGQEILGSKDLKTVDSFEQCVLLNSENTLTVTLKGQEGNLISLEILGQKEDYVPPPPDLGIPGMPSDPTMPGMSTTY